MPLGVEIGTLIDPKPGIRGGRPKIAGTALTVRLIVGWHKTGMSADQIALEPTAQAPLSRTPHANVLP